jgi:hypothetical protein
MKNLWKRTSADAPIFLPNTYNISADEQQLLCIQLRNKTSFSAKGKHNNID